MSFGEDWQQQPSFWKPHAQLYDSTKEKTNFNFSFSSNTVLLQTAISREAATGGVLSEKVFLEILQNSQENSNCNFVLKKRL